MKITAPDLMDMKIIDAIIPEVAGGAHRDVVKQASAMREHLTTTLEELTVLNAEELVQDRYEKFKAIGQFIEN